MALNIKDPQTDRLARRLAELTGTSLTVAIRDALQMRVDWVSGKVEIRDERDRAWWDDFHARVAAAKPSQAPRMTDDEILGYDEFGIPS